MLLKPHFWIISAGLIPLQSSSMSNPDYIAEKVRAGSVRDLCICSVFVIMISARKCKVFLKTFTTTCTVGEKKYINLLVSCRTTHDLKLSKLRAHFWSSRKIYRVEKWCPWWSCWFAGGARGRICHRKLWTNKLIFSLPVLCRGEGFGSSMTTYCRIVAAMCPCSPKPRTS